MTIEARVPDHCDHFNYLGVRAERVLNADEIWRLSGCIGYALRCEVNAEDLSEPERSSFRGQSTRVLYAYDTTKHQRSAPDFHRALLIAGRLAQEGTPIRKSDRSGKGTKDTRLVEGIGVCTLTFCTGMDEAEVWAELDVPARAAS